MTNCPRCGYSVYACGCSDREVERWGEETDRWDDIDTHCRDRAQEFINERNHDGDYIYENIRRWQK